MSNLEDSMFPQAASPDASASSQPPTPRRVDDDDFVARVNDMLAECGGDPESLDGRLIREGVLAFYKLVTDGRDTGEIKLLSSALKEMRYAMNVFGQYPKPHKISIFGSARTLPEHPDYQSAVEFSQRLAQTGWCVITGAGDGIMKAGHEGPGRESSFGLAIRLPFETTANTVIAGDEKLINFRYFFTRKLIFVSQSEAVAVYPGGFGTMDEIFETLTLIQTGKSAMVPVVLMEHPGGVYWKHWDNYVRRSLLDGSMVSPEDLNLYYITSDIGDAVNHVTQFYRNYHSSRYVRDDLVIRIKNPLMDGDVRRLNIEFAQLVREGEIVQRGAYPEERDHLALPRIAFTHTRRDIGLIRRLIDRINEFEPIEDDADTDPAG